MKPLAWRALVVCLTAGCAAEPRPAPTKADLRAVVDVALGGDTAMTGPYAFADVRGLAFDPRGRIIVADASLNEVRVFSPTGAFQYAITDSVAGDRQWQPCCATIAPDGRLWVVSRGKPDYSVYRLEDRRALLDRTVASPAMPSGIVTRVIWDGDGRVVLLSDEYIANRFRLVRRTLDSSGSIVHQDTLREATTASAGTVEVRNGQGSGVTSVQQPFGPRQLRAFASSGAHAEGLSSEYAVSWVRSTQTDARVITRQAERPPISSKERRKAEQTLASLSQNLHVPRSAIPVEVPERKAPLKSLGIDLSGRLWVERAVGENEDPVADVYDGDRKEPISVTWPRNVDLNLWAVRDSTALGVINRGLGTQQVVLLRLIR